MHCIQYIFFWMLLLDSLGEVQAIPSKTEYLTVHSKYPLKFPTDCQFERREIEFMYEIFHNWGNVHRKFDELYANEQYRKDFDKISTMFKQTFQKTTPETFAFDVNDDMTVLDVHKFHIQTLKTGVELLREGLNVLKLHGNDVMDATDGTDETGPRRKKLYKLDILQHKDLLTSIRTAAQQHGITQRICLEGGLDVTVDMLSMLAGCNTYPPLINFIAKAGRQKILDRILSERPDFNKFIRDPKMRRPPDQLTGSKRPLEKGSIVERALQLLWNRAKATTVDKFEDGEADFTQEIKIYQGRLINVDFRKLRATEEGRLQRIDSAVFEEYDSLYGKGRAEIVLKGILLPSTTSG